MSIAKRVPELLTVVVLLIASCTSLQGATRFCSAVRTMYKECGKYEGGNDNSAVLGMQNAFQMGESTQKQPPVFVITHE